MPPKKPFRKKYTRKPAVKKGLNKKEQLEVVKIAKKTMEVVAEKKFMDSKQFTDISFTQGRTSSPIACFGYSTTDNVGESGQPILFGQRQIEKGECLAPFFDYNRDGS